MVSVGESAIAFGVLQIAAASGNGIATYAQCKKELPKLIKLTSDDKAMSSTRPGEPMWHQLIRNIKSHHESDDNYINRGYLIHKPRVGFQITEAGRALLKKQ